MYELVEQLQKRRFKALMAVIAIALVATMVSYRVHISPLQYFGGIYNYPMIFGLIVYKFFELIILYYLLMYRYIIEMGNNSLEIQYLPKIQKHTRLLYFLIPQGNTVFGFIAYKLSGEIKYFLIFSAIALIALVIINPNRLIVTKKES